MKKIIKCILIMLVMISFSINLYAKENSESSLNISFITENNTQYMEGVDIYLYKLASYNNDKFEWDEIYNDFKIDFDKITDEDFVSATQKLDEYVKSNNINPNYKITTDSKGLANITFENGIYLISLNEVEKNNIVYKPYPYIVPMPYMDEKGISSNELSVELKYDRYDTQELNSLEQVPEKVETPVNSQSTKVKAGDYMPIISVGLIIISLIVIIIVIKRKKDKDK